MRRFPLHYDTDDPETCPMCALSRVTVCDCDCDDTPHLACPVCGWWDRADG